MSNTMAHASADHREPLWWCVRCDCQRTRAELRQVEVDEVCLYACRTCGAVEGALLVLLP